MPEDSESDCPFGSSSGGMIASESSPESRASATREMKDAAIDSALPSASASGSYR